MKKASEILENLEGLSLKLVGEAPLKSLQQDWDSSHSALLKAILPEQSPRERANATTLLFQAGDESFSSGLLPLLSEEAKDDILTELFDNINWSCIMEEHLAKMLQTDPIRKALKDRIRHSDGALLKNSLLLYRQSNDQGEEAFLEKEFSDASGSRRLAIALILSGDANHSAAWNSILDEARGHPPQDWHFQIRNAITKHLTSPDADLAGEAEAFLTETITTFLDEPGTSMEQSTVLAFLDHAKSTAALPAIRKIQVRYSGRDTVIEGRALQSLTRLDEETSVAELESRLEDPAISYDAARAILSSRSTPPDDALLEKLLTASRNCYGSYFEPFVKLIRDCGHPMAHDHVRSVLEEKTPGLTLRILGESEGWNSGRIGEIATQCGILSAPPTQDQLSEAEKICDEPENIDDLAAAILHVCGRLIEIDLEADEIPPDYIDLLKQLAEISGGHFFPENLSSKPVSDDSGASKVAFHFGGKLIKFTTEDLRDWFDEATVLKTVNEALESTRTVERYRAFEPRGQHLQIVFARPEALDAFSKQTGIPLAKADVVDTHPESHRANSLWSRIKNRFRQK